MVARSDQARFPRNVAVTTGKSQNCFFKGVLGASSLDLSFSALITGNVC